MSDDFEDDIFDDADDVRPPLSSGIPMVQLEDPESVRLRIEADERKGSKFDFREIIAMQRDLLNSKTDHISEIERIMNIAYDRFLDEPRFQPHGQNLVRIRILDELIATYIALGLDIAPENYTTNDGEKGNLRYNSNLSEVMGTIRGKVLKWKHDQLQAHSEKLDVLLQAMTENQ